MGWAGGGSIREGLSWASRMRDISAAAEEEKDDFRQMEGCEYLRGTKEPGVLER